MAPSPSQLHKSEQFHENKSVTSDIDFNEYSDEAAKYHFGLRGRSLTGAIAFIAATGENFSLAIPAPTLFPHFSPPHPSPGALFPAHLPQVSHSSVTIRAS